MRRSKYHPYIATVIFIVSALFSSCEKFVDIDSPISNLTTNTAFLTDVDIEANIAGLHSYNLLSSSYFDIYRHLYPGFSADEIGYYTSSATIDQFVANNILTSNTTSRYMWSEPYKSIYQSNLMLSQLKNASNISINLKNEGMGVSYFFRALSYLNLITIFGDVPLVTEIDVTKTATLSRSAKSIIYELIIADLLKAKDLLKDVNKEHGWVSQAAATAILARAYLYSEQWERAVNEANSVVTGAAGKSFVLENVENTFLRSSKETIFAISTDGSSTVTVNHTYAGRYYIPSNNFRATYFITDDLLAAFEDGDLRKENWIKQFTAAEQKKWYPYKYKLRATPGDVSLAEDQVLIRLAELYLIRAEANAQLGNLLEATTDLNTIRNRAGLAGLSGTLSKEQVLLAVEQERRVELFCEYGHRWVDLIRTKRADEVLGLLKGSAWNSWGQLYPVPEKDIELNTNLIQNPGYNVQ